MTTKGVEDPGISFPEDKTVYNIETTADIEGYIEIEIDYSEERLKMKKILNYYTIKTGSWSDVTKSVDIENDKIKGEVSSLSPFVILEDIEPPVLFGVPADLIVECSSDVPVNPEVTATDNVAGSVLVEYSEVREDGTCINDYVITKTWTASDDFENTTSQSQVVIVSDNTPPVITIPANVTLECNMSTEPASTGLGTATDNCDGAVVITFEDVLTADCGNTGIITRTWAASDACGNTSTGVQTVTIVDTIPPVLSNLIVPIDPISVGTSVPILLDYQDDTLTEALIDWGDGYQSSGDIGQNVITGEHAYSIPGVYVLHIRVQDACENEASVIHQYVVIYDPEGGFVTGGGWIFSPEGAYKPDPLLTGKANFGFVSKYKKGSSVPDGNTEFQFKAGNLNFKSIDYEWLVIAGSKAMFKGSGTINGFGYYGFMLSALDADLTPSADIDKFRIKIWDKDNNDFVVYDNNLEVDDNADPTTEISGGSIVIHTSKHKSAQIEYGVIPKTEDLKLSVYPNPFTESLKFEFVSPENAHASIDIFDVTGRKVKTVFNGSVEGNVPYTFEFVPASEESNLYFYQIRLGEEVIYGKVVYTKR